MKQPIYLRAEDIDAALLAAVARLEAGDLDESEVEHAEATCGDPACAGCGVDDCEVHS